MNSRQMTPVVACGDSLLDSKPGQRGLDHRGELAGKFLSSLGGLPDAGAAAQSERASLEPHLLRAFKHQPFGRKLTRNDSPRSRPSLAPARQDQFPVGELNSGALGIYFRHQKLVFEQIELAAKQESLELIL